MEDAFPGRLAGVIVLGLDTTTPQGSVAVWKDGVLVAIRPTDPGRPHSDQLPGAVDDLLRARGLAVADVDVFGVASGPGSLTGLRVGIATIQGLAFALGRPVVAVSALEALASAATVALPALDVGDCAGAWTNAHRGEVFAALYLVEPESRDGEGLLLLDGPTVGAPAELVARWATCVEGRRLRVAGNAAESSATLFLHRLGPATAVTEGPLLAGTIAELAGRRARRGEVMSPHALQPLYVRRPDAEVARDRARALMGHSGSSHDQAR